MSTVIEIKRIQKKEDFQAGVSWAEEIINSRKTVLDLLHEVVGYIEGPEDGSYNHDHYLYGLPKKETPR